MRTIKVNDIDFIIQSYRESDFVNLSPMQDSRNTPFDKRLGSIRITFYDNRITTCGKENKYWKEFVSKIDIRKLKSELEFMFNPNLIK